MDKPWICPVCNRGVAPGEKTCDHGGAATAPFVPMFPHPMIPSPTTWPQFDPRTRIGDPMPWDSHWSPPPPITSTCRTMGYAGLPAERQPH